jgi:hypothetical protein
MGKGNLERFKILRFTALKHRIKSVQLLCLTINLKAYGRQYNNRRSKEKGLVI